MDKIIIKVLKQIEDNGYEAYIIGGMVRDLLVGVSSFDIDICSNATPKELIRLFPNASSKNLGGIDFKIKEYHFEITTYREELNYKNRKPVEFNYISNLLTDLQRRDFTINAICMNQNGEIIDLLNGTKDLKEKRVRVIGDVKTKIKEDPLRILRGIRIATVLNFQIDECFYKEIKKNYKEVLKLSNTRIKEELDKILLSENVRKGLQLLHEFHLLKLLKMEYNKKIVPVKNLEGMYAQLRFQFDFPFTKEEKNNISLLKEIIKGKKIDSYIVYHYGLYLSLIAGEILNVNKNVIANIHKNLPIHELKDIQISSKEILDLGFSKEQISGIMKQLEQEILSGKLENNKDQIIELIKYYKKGR